MADSSFGDYYSISQGREVDLSPNERKGLFHNTYYKFYSVLGGYYLYNKENNLYINQPWVYFVCQFNRKGAEFYTPNWFSLSCNVKKGGDEYIIDIFNEKAHGKYIGYNYEGDTALIAFRIDAAYFKGVDEIISFTPTIDGVGGTINTTYKISEQGLLKSLCWYDNNLKITTYTSGITKTQVFIQDWYNAYDITLSSYYNNGTKSYKYYNTDFYFSFNQGKYLSNTSITPDKVNFYCKDGTSILNINIKLPSSTSKSRNILIDNNKVQGEFFKISFIFESKANILNDKGEIGEEVTLTKEIVIQDKPNFKHYKYALDDLQKSGTFELKKLSTIKRNEAILLSEIAYTIQIPEDFPYDFTNTTLTLRDKNDNAVVDAVIENDKIKIDKTEEITIKIPINSSSMDSGININITYSNGSGNEKKSIFLNGWHTLKGDILNRFTNEKNNKTIFSISPNFNKQYILLDGVNYQIQASTTQENGSQVDIPGKVLLSGEYISITQTADITKYIIDTESLTLIDNCNSIDFTSKCKMDYGQDLYDLGESKNIIATDSTSNTLKYYYNTLNPNSNNTNLTYFIYLEPILSANLNNNETVTVKTYNESFTIGRLVTPIVNQNFTPKFEGNTLKYSLTEYGGDKNDYYDSNFFINARLKQAEYFSLSRYFNSNAAYENLEIKFFEKNGDNYNTSPSVNCTVIINTSTVLKQIMLSFQEGVMNELDLSVLTEEAKEAPWTNLIGKTVKIEISYYYEKDDYSKSLIDFELPDVVIQSGSRSLGLRKNGIIVAPVKQKEDLPLGTAQRINLKTQLSSDNTKRNGTALEVRVCDAAGTPLKNNDQEITCTIEYRNNDASNNGAGAFYFNGVNLSELKNTVNNSETGLVTKVRDLETTVGDSSSGLVKKVDQNTTNISSLLGLECFVLDAFAKDNGNVKVFEDGASYTGSIVFDDTRITANSICMPFLSVFQQLGANENTEHIKLLRENLRLCSTGLSQAAGSASLGYAIYIPKEALYNYNIRLKGRLLVINLPSVLTSSINLDSLSMDDEEMINTTLSNEAIQTIIEDEENLTTP